MFFKQKKKRNFECKYASFKNIKFPRTTITPIVPRHKHSYYCLYCSTLNFLPRASSKIILNYFQLFETKAMKNNVKFEKENRQNPLQYNFSLFSTKPLVYRKFSRACTIYPGIFCGRAPSWADGVSPRMNTCVSGLVVNYHSCYYSTNWNTIQIWS